MTSEDRISLLEKEVAELKKFFPKKRPRKPRKPKSDIKKLVEKHMNKWEPR